jgi:hypothetical protein
MWPHNIIGQEITDALRQTSRVFLSHRMADADVTREIAEYFEFLGLHYYFDEKDEVLRELVACGHSDDVAVVESIDRGLAHSSHLLAILSSRTMGSWWVPYEIGVARASKIPIAHLLLPSIKPAMVPEYLRLYPQLWTPQDLFAWLRGFVPWPGAVVNRAYRAWSEDSIFGELGPDEEDVEEWFRSAERENDGRLLHLRDVFTGVAANVAELLPPAIEPDAPLRARTPPRSKEIHVTVRTPGGERLEIEAPRSMTAEELLHELLDELWLPRRDAEEQPVAYRLESINLAQELDPDRTLDELGISDGDRLILIPRVTAGGSHTTRRPRDAPHD